MAVEISNGTTVPHASGHLDLLDKLVTFLTGPALGSQAWTLEKTSGDERYLSGPGLSGGDSIHVNISALQDVSGDYYYWSLYGATGFNDLEPISNQPGSSLVQHLHLWQSDIQYWFIANGRRFIVVAKISTTYHCMYGGFYLPYFSPLEFPYPYYIAGNTSTPSRRWSTEDFDDSNFWNPGEDMSSLRRTDGGWLRMQNHRGISGSSSDRYDHNIWPWTTQQTVAFKGKDIRNNLDGSHTLFPAVLHSIDGGGNVFGELDGVFWISGFANASENIHIINSKNYLVIQDINRTGRNDYAAILLE